MNQRLSEQKANARHCVAWGRTCLLAVVMFSLVNQLLLALGVDYHFLISAAVPYYADWICLKINLTGIVPTLMTLGSVALYVAYVACWALSRKGRVWLSVALGLYGLDTLLLIVFTFTLLENPLSCVLEIVTHLACLAMLVMAVHSAGELSRIRHTEWHQHTYDTDEEGFVEEKVMIDTEEPV